MKSSGEAKKIIEELQYSGELRIPRETAEIYRKLAVLANVTTEQAMQVCLALSVLNLSRK